MLRSNLTGGDPAQLWGFYLQLTEVEQAFKELKNDLAIRPIYHQTDERITRGGPWPPAVTVPDEDPTSVRALWEGAGGRRHRRRR